MGVTMGDEMKDETTSRQLKCAYCRTRIERAGNPHFPFCTDHCRLLDLSKWLNEEYSVPALITERDVPLIMQVVEE